MDDVLIVVVVLAVSGIFIYVWGKVVESRWAGMDPLREANLCGSELDVWSMAHFFLFFALGFFFPQWTPFFVIFGAVWEGIEAATGDPNTRRSLLWLEDGEADPKDDKFWYAKVSDIAVDIYGLLAGVVMRAIYDVDR